MILNLDKKIWPDSFQRFLVFFTHIKSYFLRRKEIGTLFNDSKELKKIYSSKFPKLIKPIDQNILCISCGLCEKICPTEAISLEKSRMFDIPESFSQGEVPKALKLDLEACNLCTLCEYVCPVDAIEMKGDFQGDSMVDLVNIFNNQTKSSAKEIQN